MQRSDAIRHMLDAARMAMTLTKERIRGDLDRDVALALALVKLLEIIGEAAAKVTKECRVALPMIPWENIVGMRHRLIHAYYDINLDLVWRTVTEDLPPLTAALCKALSDEEAGGFAPSGGRAAGR